MAELPDGLGGWTEALAQRQLPIFSETATWILAKADTDTTSSHELSSQILRDVAMTSRLLKAANSWHFNPGGQPISTVSRAIVVLGFNQVRDICLSIKMLDSFVRGDDRDHVLPQMVDSLQAAAQARELAKLARTDAPEEVYVAALLYRVGELALLAFGHDLAPEKMRGLLRERPADSAGRDKQCDDLLGFDTKQLSERLNKEWRLSELLGQVFDPSRKSTRTAAVQFGHELVDALREGNDSDAVAKTLARIEQSMKLPRAALKDTVAKTRVQAAREMEGLGIPPAHARASAGEAPSESEKGGALPPPANTEMEAANASAPWSEADPMLLLQVMGDLSQLLGEAKPNTSAILTMTMEGLFRAVGLDRVVFALLSPDRKALRAKHLIGHGDEDELKRFQFDAQPGGDPLLYNLVRDPRPRWLGKGGEDLERGRPSAFLGYSGGACFVLPLIVGGQPLGVLYADRKPSARSLDATLFGQFQMLAGQARMGFALLKGGA